MKKVIRVFYDLHKHTFMTYYSMKNFKSHLFYIKLSKLFVKPDQSLLITNKMLTPRTFYYHEQWIMSCIKIRFRVDFIHIPHHKLSILQFQREDHIGRFKVFFPVTAPAVTVIEQSVIFL